MHHRIVAASDCSERSATMTADRAAVSDFTLRHIGIGADFEPIALHRKQVEGRPRERVVSVIKRGLIC